MTYSMHINQVKAIEWDLSLKASILLSKIVVLSSWAKPIVTNEGVYYVLFRAKIIEELPMIGRSLATISKYIKELENKGIIESTNKNLTPAYRLSEKGKEWVSSKGEVQKSKNVKKDEAFTFLLIKNSSYHQL